MLTSLLMASATAAPTGTDAPVTIYTGIGLTSSSALKPSATTTSVLATATKTGKTSAARRDGVAKAVLGAAVGSLVFLSVMT